MNAVVAKRIEELQILPGPEDATILALGGTPGKAYETRR